MIVIGLGQRSLGLGKVVNSKCGIMKKDCSIQLTFLSAT